MRVLWFGVDGPQKPHSHPPNVPNYGEGLLALSQSFDLGAPKYCCEVARFCHPNFAEILLNFSRMARCELANKC